MIYVNKTGNRITFKIKTGYHLELLTPKTRTLLGSTKSKITKDVNGKNVPCLDISHIGPLQYCQQRLSARFKSFEIFSQLLDISPKNFIFI